MFTLSDLWQIFLAICGSIVTIAGAVVIIYKLYKKAKQPDSERDKMMKKHERKLENCNARLNSVEDGQAVMMEAVLAILNHLIDGEHVDDLKESAKKVNSYLIKSKTEVLKNKEV